MILRRVIAHFRKQFASAPLIPAQAGTQPAPAGAHESDFLRRAGELDPGLIAKRSNDDLRAFARGRRDERVSRSGFNHPAESLAP